MTLSLLSALLEIINSSTHTLQAELATAHLPEPWLDVPALHPWDEHTPSLPYWEARRTLLSALAMMTAVVQNPREKILVQGMAYHHPAALNFAVRARIPDVLATPEVNEPIGLPVDEISRRAGTHPTKTTVILRFLASHNIFNETAPCVFANNKLSHVLKAADPTAGAPIFWGEVAFRAATMLSRTLRAPATASSFDPADAPFARAFAHGFEDLELVENCDDALVEKPVDHAVASPRTTFALLGSSRHAAYSASFAAGMRALDCLHGPDGLRDVPWERWDTEGSVFVDVGASTGHLALTLLPALRHATFVCQDRPEVCAQGEAFFREHCPAELRPRVVFQPNDFLAGQPVEGAPLYILSNILHDWPAPEALRILRHIAAAMGPRSRLLVIEVVVDPAGGEGEAPWPLRAYGAADAYAHHQSVEMVNLFNALDRTLEEYATMFGEAGMKLVQVWRVRRVACVMEVQQCVP